MLITETSVNTIIQKLSKEAINLLLVAEHTALDVGELIERCNEEGITIGGGIFPMIINDVDHMEKGIILKKISADHKAHLVKDMATAIPDDLPDLSAEVNSSVVILDGLSSDIPKMLNMLYEKYWSNISYMGGGAGSLSLEQNPCVFTNEGFFENACLLIFSAKRTQQGVKHGWKKISGPFIANKTQGNKVIELNWKPAFKVYKDVVEHYTDKNFSSSDFFDISKGFPFGIYRDGQEDIVRDPISVDESGALVCVGEVGTNTSLNILKGDLGDLIDSAKEASLLAKRDNIGDLLICDCISRVLYLGDDFSKELESVKKVVDASVEDLEGMLSLGEISSVNGYLEFYNKSIVVSSFY